MNAMVLRRSPAFEFKILNGLSQIVTGRISFRRAISVSLWHPQHVALSCVVADQAGGVVPSTSPAKAVAEGDAA